MPLARTNTYKFYINGALANAHADADQKQFVDSTALPT